MENYKDLNLDLQYLNDVIQEFLKLQCVENYSFTEEKNGRNRLEFELNDKKVLVDFYFLKNGTTTIAYNIGPAPEIGLKLAEYCKEKLTTDQRKNINVSVNVKDLSTFLLLREYFCDDQDNFTVIDQNDDKSCAVIKIESLKYHDSMSVTYYKTTCTLLLQGKPLYTYYQIAYFLSEFADIDAFFDIITKFGDDEKLVPLKQIDVAADLDKILINSKPYLGDILYNLLKTSYLFKFQDIQLPEYSCIVFPALRALEGVIRRILFDNEIRVEAKKNKFKEIFDFDRDGNVSMKGEIVLQVKSKIIIPLCDCYKFLNKQRNNLFHTNDLTDASRIIEKKIEAYSIIDEVLTLIDKTYYTINN